MADEVVSSFELELEKGSGSPRRARRAVQELLGDDAAIAVIRDAVLLTSELVTNAVEHCDGGCTVTASFDRRRRRLRVEVADSSGSKPLVRRGVPRADGGGRGMVIVEQLAQRWGCDRAGSGKVVWFELDVS